MRILGPILMAWAGWVSVTLIQMGQDIAVIKKQVAENARVTTEIPASISQMRLRAVRKQPL